VFPTEDTDLFDPTLLRKPDEPDGVAPIRPPLSYGLGDLSQRHTLYLLKVWNFVYTYAFPLQIYPMRLDEFISGICTNSPATVDVMPEVFGNMLTLVCREWYLRFDPNGYNRYQAENPTQDLNGNWSSDASVSEMIGSVMGQYAKFTPEERGGVDQWYKWVCSNLH
jgi:DDT domain